MGDGSARLDFTYIDDLVSGIVCVLSEETAKNQIFNLTYGESRSVKQMTEIVAEHFPDTTISYLPKDELMPDRGTLSVDKARRMIGYDPQYPLEIGFVNYINWYQELFKQLK